MSGRDPSLDNLLFLDGYVAVVDREARYWIKFEVKQVAPSPNKPHGLDYSLTLHGPDSGDPNDSRLIGFDNAHAVAGKGRSRRPGWDHKHRLRTVQPYDYQDAATLLGDFYEAAERMLDERGVKR